jgi:hypothetical protein
MNDIKTQNNFDLKQVLNQPYKYGFQTNVEKETFPNGINEEIIHLLSNKKNEPKFLLEFRLRAYQKWKKLNFPLWANLKVEPINYEKVNVYSSPKKKPQLQLWDNRLKKQESISQVPQGFWRFHWLGTIVARYQGAFRRPHLGSPRRR